MGTIVNPLDGEYDIDDGVYLQNLDKENKDSWPTPETVHSWIYKAVEGHTKEDPIDKRIKERVSVWFIQVNIMWICPYTMSIREPII